MNPSIGALRIQEPVILREPQIKGQPMARQEEKISSNSWRTSDSHERIELARESRTSHAGERLNDESIGYLLSQARAVQPWFGFLYLLLLSLSIACPSEAIIRRWDKRRKLAHNIKWQAVDKFPNSFRVPLPPSGFQAFSVYAGQKADAWSEEEEKTRRKA